MCGRYASSRSPDELVEEFEVDRSRVEEPLPPDWNVAPTKEVYAVLERVVDPPGRERQLRAVRWGLVPSWADDPAVGTRMINARRETVADKPAFRRAFARRRCLLPADGYYEWYPTEDRTRSGTPRKQPFFVRPRDGGVLAMAGLYELWRDPTRAGDDPGRWRWTCTVLTTQAEDAVGRIHDRMPLTVPRERWADWLDPGTDGRADLLHLLAPAAPGGLEAYPVSPKVGDVRNNGPELVEPLPLEAVAGDLEDMPLLDVAPTAHREGD